jgi:hypothetical protein
MDKRRFLFGGTMIFFWVCVLAMLAVFAIDIRQKRQKDLSRRDRPSAEASFAKQRKSGAQI